MKTKRISQWMGVWLLAATFFWAVPVSAQTFSSGSTGALGAFAPSSNTVVTLPPDGVLNYTTVNVPSGVTVTFARNAANTPVTMLATGNIVIAGTINLNGASGAFTGTGPVVNPGGLGGPGGFAGGQSGMRGLTNNAGTGGLGPGGGNPGVDGTTVQGGTYGAPSAFVSLIPLFGGSGGGGTNGGADFAGGSGGGAGGAIVLASTTKITVTGSITANGVGQNFCGTAAIGHGSGGAIRLVAPEISTSGTGTLQATGVGFVGSCNSSGPGRIRIEALVTGQIALTNPTASISNTLGPITANSTPALINLPTLTISSVGGVAAPSTVTGSYTTADVFLPTGTTNPVPVTVTVTNTPLSTPFTVKMIPQFAAPSSATCSNTSGSFISSTCTANVTFPSGRISTLNAFASFTLTASLMPLIDGEPAEQVLVGAAYGEPSTVTLRTRSGKEITADRLSPDDQVKFARAWEDFSRTR